MSAVDALMKEANARQAKAGATVTVTIRKMRRKHKIMLIIFSLVMMAVLKTGFIFFVIGMMPCVVAYYMDVTKHRYMFKSVFNANLSGMMPFIVKMIHNGPSSALLQEIMGNSSNWFIIYGSAFLGWLLVKICPMVAQIMVSGVHQTQVVRYEWMQKKIESEWGPEVTQFSDKKAT